jgi:ADP-heptose:LPS heptosyltransferase
VGRQNVCPRFILRGKNKMGEKSNISYESPLKNLDLNKQFLRFTIGEIIKEVPKLWSEKDDVNLKICLVRYGARGDVLLMTPIVRKIKEKYKNIHITISTDYPDMMRNNPYVDNIISIKQDYSKYDRTYFLAYEFNPSVHIVKAYAEQVGIEIDDYKPELYLTENELATANRALDKIGCKNFFVVHAECDWRSRRWHSWSELFERLQNDDKLKTYKIIEVGKDKPKFDHLNIPMIKHDDIRIIAAIIQYSTAVVCIDSAIMHLGVALNKPVFSIFGITDPNKRLPQRWIPLATQHDGKTSGIHHTRPIPTESEPTNVDECVSEMRNLIRGELVYSKIKMFLENISVNFSLIIPSYNKVEYTYDCIMSILRDSEWLSFLEIIIADDCSANDTKKRLDVFDRLCSVQLYEEKAGFTKNCNRAAKLAKGEIIILLNNDTKLITKDWLKYIWEDLQDKENGIVGVKLLYPDMTIQHAGCICDGKHFRHIYKHLPRNYK